MSRVHPKRICTRSTRWYIANLKKPHLIFKRHLVCHVFLSITFAFRGCSRSVEALNCHSDQKKKSGNNFEKKHLNFWRKPKKQMLNHVKSANRNEQSDPLRPIRFRFCRHRIVHILQGHTRLFKVIFEITQGHFRSFLRSFLRS